VDDFDGRRLPGIVGIFLEGSSKDANGFALEVEVKRLEDPQKEVLFSVFVDFNDGVPVISYFG
jgi:hypothetical protein